MPATLRRQFSMTLLVLVLTAVLDGPEPVAAQVEDLSREVLAGKEAGEKAAGSQGTKAFFFTSAAGGLLAGAASPWTGGGPVATGVGVFGIVLSFGIADLSQPSPPTALLPALQSKGPDYREAFLTAYSDHLRGRRRNAALAGGLTGLVAGVVLYFVLAPGT